MVYALSSSVSEIVMSNPLKKRAFGENPLRRASGSSEGSGSDNESNPDVYTGNEEIQVDFEGRNPQDSDFHGIKALLQQLFLKSHVNLSELSNIIISQAYVGSVVKQSDLDVPDDEMDEEYKDANDVFGITTVVSLKHRHESECIQQIRQLLSELAEQYASIPTRSLIDRVLAANTGLLLSERLVNIPPQICAPLFDSLKSEIEKASKKNMPFNFDYYIMICKMYKTDTTKKTSKKNKNKDPDIIWSNAEEEIIFPEAIDSFEFTVKSESDSGLTGNWLEEDSAMIPYRKVLIIDASKLDHIIDTVKAYVS